MLKKIKNHLRKSKKSELKVTPDEEIIDIIIKAGIKIAQESGYTAGNTTEKLVEMASNGGNLLDRISELVGSVERAGFLGRISFKTTKDIARGDNACTGLCLIYGTC